MNRRQFLTSILAGIASLPFAKLLPFLPQPVIKADGVWEGQVFSAHIWEHPLSKEEIEAAYRLVFDVDGITSFVPIYSSDN